MKTITKLIKLQADICHNNNSLLSSYLHEEEFQNGLKTKVNYIYTKGSFRIKSFKKIEVKMTLLGKESSSEGDKKKK